MTPDDALAIQRALEVLQRAHAASTPTLTVRELHAQYEPWYRANHKSWRSAFVPRWKHLLGYFGDRAAAAISLVDADAYRVERATAAPETRDCELSSLRAAFGWAVKRRLLPSNPLAGMDSEHAPNARTAFLDEAGFARLAAAAPNPMARALFTVAFDTGMRRGELLELQRAAVDFDERIIRLGDADCKNGEGRVVPVGRRAMDTLRELPAWSPYVFSLTGGKLARATVHKWFADAREKSGTSPAMTFHGLRHSAATAMRRRGVPYPLIKAALGWKSEIAARRYQQFDQDDWASLRERMDEGIAADARKPPLRSVPEKHEPDRDVISGVKTLTQK